MREAGPAADLISRCMERIGDNRGGRTSASGWPIWTGESASSRDDRHPGENRSVYGRAASSAVALQQVRLSQTLAAAIIKQTLAPCTIPAGKLLTTC